MPLGCQINRHGHVGERGFTMAEVLVGLVILGVLSIGVGALVRTVMTHQQTFNAKDEVGEFVASFSRWITTNDGCETALRTKRFPGSDLEDLEVDGYQGYGMSDVMGAGTTLKSGFRISPQITLARLQWKDKGIAPALINMGTNTYERRTAHIEMEFQLAVGDATPAERIRTMEVPLFIDPPSTPGKIVRTCFTEMNSQNVCAALGYEATTPGGPCLPKVNTSCRMAGTYKTLTCSPSGYGCHNAVHPEPLENQLTGAASCPPGSVGSRTAIFKYPHTVSCGKKCTLTVTNTMEFHICMACTTN